MVDVAKEKMYGQNVGTFSWEILKSDTNIIILFEL